MQTLWDQTIARWGWNSNFPHRKNAGQDILPRMYLILENQVLLLCRLECNTRVYICP